jgi:hypothetical protein
MLTSREGATSPSLVGGAVAAAEQRLPAVAGRGALSEVDYTRPLLLGYILKHLLMTDGELADTKDQLEQFAAVEGFAMGTIYVEETETTPAAFEALIAAVNRYEVTTVVIPSRLHFAALAVIHDVKDTFERATGARVVIANPSP